MTPPFHPDELGVSTPPAQRIELKAIAQRLEAERPVPAAAFRGDLRRALLGHGRPLSRPARLRLQIALYGSSGFVLLLAGVFSVAGVGPLAA